MLIIVGWALTTYGFIEANQDAQRSRTQLVERVTKQNEILARIAEQNDREEAALQDISNREDEILALLRKRQEQPTYIVVRDRSPSSDPDVIVVQPTPRPQPTATVTCNPTPIIGNCRRPSS